MIKSIKISNFKSFKEEQTIVLGGLTLLSGLNSSGKSTVYQVLLLLMQSFEATKVEPSLGELPILVLNGNLIQLGKKDELLNDYQNKTMKFGIVWGDDSELHLDFTLESFDVHGVTYEDFVLTKLRVENSKVKGFYELQLDTVNRVWSIEANSVLEFASRDFERSFDTHMREVAKDRNWDATYNPQVKFKAVTEVSFFGYDLLTFKIKLEDTLECINPDRRDGFDFEEVKRLYQTENNQPFEYNEVTLMNNYKFSGANVFLRKGVVNIPPFRGYPRRYYTEGQDKNPLIQFNRRKLDQIKYSYDFEKNVEKVNTFEEALNYWVVEFFKFGDGVQVNEIVPDFTSELFLKIGKKQISINNMGFGVSQILPIIFRLLQSDEMGIFIVDEPEIHLHPEMQSRLADFFIQMALIGKRIILETHSEYLINRLIYLSVKYEVVEKTNQMYWVDRKSDSSILRKIKYDNFGFLIDAPIGFLTEAEETINNLNELRFNKMGKT